MTVEANEHDIWRDTVALYALDALPADERRALEAHLQSCAECAVELLTLRPAADALAQAVPQFDPRPELRARVLSVAVPAQAPAVSLATPAAPPESRETANKRVQTVRSRSGGPIGWLSLAAMFALSAGLGIYANSLRARVASLEADLNIARAQTVEMQARVNATELTLATTQTHLDVLSSPDAVRVNMAGQAPSPNASGRADWSRSRGLALSVANLPPLQPNRTYQVWLLTAGNPVSAGLVQPDAAGRLSAVYATPADVPQPTGVALSEEPEGGVPLPTGQIYLVGLLSRAQ